MGKLIIDGNKVYEIDEQCLERKKREEERQQERKQGKKKRRNLRA